MHSYQESTNAWKKAVALCVPSDGFKLTRAEQTQMQNCQEGLKTAKDAKDKRDKQGSPKFTTVRLEQGNSLPWHRALKMEVDIRKIGLSSVSHSLPLAISLAYLMR